MSQVIKDLFKRYEGLTPQVKSLNELFSKHERSVVVDHFALRTFSHPKVNLQKLIDPFLKEGYEIKGDYIFEKKNLKAVHLEKEGMPRVFASELQLEKCSPAVRKILNRLGDQVEEFHLRQDEGCLWQVVSKEEYETLAAESEYAAWVSVWGMTINHYAADIKQLGFESTEELNSFLKDNGYRLNTVGGEIKGTPALGLVQSATISDQVEIIFSCNTKYLVPGCFYEFAYRYNNFQGFIADNANKIFHSTDRK